MSRQQKYHALESLLKEMVKSRGEIYTKDMLEDLIFDMDITDANIDDAIIMLRTYYGV